MYRAEGTQFGPTHERKNHKSKLPKSTFLNQTYYYQTRSYNSHQGMKQDLFCPKKMHLAFFRDMWKTDKHIP